MMRDLDRILSDAYNKRVSLLLTCSLMNATLQLSSFVGFDPLLLATGTFMMLEAEDEVPFDIRRL